MNQDSPEYPMIILRLPEINPTLPPKITIQMPFEYPAENALRLPEITLKLP